MKLIASLIISLFLAACGQQQKAETPVTESAASATAQPSMPPPPPTLSADTLPKKPTVNPYEKAKITVKTYQNNSGEVTKGTWGYDIYIDKSPTPYIHQPSVPAVAGNDGFATEAKARKAGEFVGYKIKHNMMPPSVTPAELDSLGVLK